MSRQCNDRCPFFKRFPTEMGNGPGYALERDRGTSATNRALGHCDLFLSIVKQEANCIHEAEAYREEKLLKMRVLEHQESEWEEEDE